MTSETNDGGPLASVRVLDLTQIMAGPFCTMLLGDMGADVIKIEQPGVGDQSRKSMAHRTKGPDSPGFLALNRNKRSVALDLKTKAGREALHHLATSSDVVVENGRPGVTTRLEADYATLSALNPKLIYCSISGFGQNGPWAQRPGLDLIAQAMSGVVSATGTPDGPPVKSDIPVGDLGAGLFAAYAILSALVGRSTSGRGQYIDTSLFDATLALSVWASTEYWATGVSPRPLGTANRMSAPYEAFRALDGWFVLGAANQKLWRALCGAIDRTDLVADARFAENIDRMRNQDALAVELQRTFLENTTSYWVESLLDAGVPAGPINSYADALESAHARARGLVMDVQHPLEGTYRSLGFAAKLSATPAALRRPPPLLGEHTDDVMAEIGLGEARARLAAEGAFGA